MADSTSYQKRINRWHDKSMDMLTFSINLLFTISLALLGFIYSFDSIELKECLLCRLFIYFCILSGILATCTRMVDFKLTHKTAKKLKDKFESKGKSLSAEEAGYIDIEIEELRKRTRCLGKITWKLFYAQVVFFLSGLIVFIIVVEKNFF